MSSKSNIFKKGTLDIAPHLLSVIPFGIIFGAIGIELGFDPYLIYGTSLIIFGGKPATTATQEFTAETSAANYKTITTS